MSQDGSRTNRQLEKGREVLCRNFSFSRLIDLSIRIVKLVGGLVRCICSYTCRFHLTIRDFLSWLSPL